MPPKQKMSFPEAHVDNLALAEQQQQQQMGFNTWAQPFVLLPMGEAPLDATQQQLHGQLNGYSSPAFLTDPVDPHGLPPRRGPSIHQQLLLPSLQRTSLTSTTIVPQVPIPYPVDVRKRSWQRALLVPPPGHPLAPRREPEVDGLPAAYVEQMRRSQEWDEARRREAQARDKLMRPVSPMLRVRIQHPIRKRTPEPVDDRPWMEKRYGSRAKLWHGAGLLKPATIPFSFSPLRTWEQWIEDREEEAEEREKKEEERKRERETKKKEAKPEEEETWQERIHRLLNAPRPSSRISRKK